MTTPREQVASCAAVVVDFFAESSLAQCVESLHANGVTNVVVVDNSEASASASALGALAVTLVETGQNLGYGRGMNRGVAFTNRPEFLLISNPDVVYHDGAVTAMEDVLRARPDVAIVGPNIHDAGGATYPSVRVFPNVFLAGLHAVLSPWWPHNPWSVRYRSPSRDGHVDWVSGASFLIRYDVFQQLGGFDERYFMFAEDMDLCWRAGEAGYRVAVAPSATITHVEGVSRRRAPRRMLRAHHVSAIRFEVHTARGLRRALVPLAVAVLWARYLALAPFSAKSSTTPTP